MSHSTASAVRTGKVSLPVAENPPPVVLSSRRDQTAPAHTVPTAAGQASFEPLLAYAKDGSRPFTLRRSGQTVKLAWPGVQVSPSQLAELLRTLPGGRRLDGATRVGSRVAAFSYDGKLRRGRLAPPSSEGMVLVWTDPGQELLELEQAVPKNFEPQGDCLGRLVLDNGGQRAVARIYRHLEQTAPGFVLLRQGQLVCEIDWLATLERPEEARLCQVVVEGDVAWESGVPEAFQPRFQKLARLAAQKSKELLETRPAAADNRAFIPSLLESPRFLALSEGLRGSLPPTATIGQILELLQLSGGRRRVQELREALEIPEARFEEILLQTNRLLANEEDVCLSRSLDGTWLLFHQDALIRMFSLNPEARASEGLVTAVGLDGQERRVDVAVELEPKERRVLEALLRYGKLSERELSQLVGSRRIGGLLERLHGRLETAGQHLLRVAGTSDDGRIYEILLPATG